MKTSTLRHAVSIALLVAATGMAEPTRAQKAAADTSPPPRAAVTGSPIDIDIDLPAGTLAAALDALGKQSGLRLDYPRELIAGKQARTVHGR